LALKKLEKKRKVQLRLQNEAEIMAFDYSPNGFIKQDPVSMLVKLKQMKVQAL